MKNKYTVLWVDDCNPKTSTFKTKSSARAFVKNLVKKDSYVYYITGLVVGEYLEAKLDGKDISILERLK